jgi:hypothetical protein
MTKQDKNYFGLLLLGIIIVAYGFIIGFYYLLLLIDKLTN